MEGQSGSFSPATQAPVLGLISTDSNSSEKDAGRMLSLF
jgi:hypothetical protein